jgi:hypothetical protein
MKSTFFGRAAFAILAAFVFAFPILGIGALKALRTNSNDVKQWLPEKYQETQIYRWFRSHFSSEEFILVSWEGCTLDDERLELFTAKIMTATLPVPEAKRDAGGPPPADPPLLFSKIITGPTLLDQLTRKPTDLDVQTALERLDGTLIGHDLNTTCAVLSLTDAAKSDLHGTLSAVIDTAVRECAVPRETLHMGGPPVDNVAIDRAGQESLFRLAGLAGLIGLVISWWCLRSGKLVTLVFAMGIYTAAASLGIVYYSGSTLNAILLTMPPLVYVAAVSGAIHLSNYYRETAMEEGVEGAPGRAVRHATLPITLATITTAVGLLSLCISELVPIQMFGFFSAVGVGVSMIVLMLLLPSILQLFPVKKFPKAGEGSHGGDPMLGRWWDSVGRWIIRRWGLVAAGLLAAMGICAYGMTRVETSVHLMRLFDSKDPILRDYAWLEDNLGELIPLEVIVEIDPAKTTLNMLEQMELVNGMHRSIENVEEVGGSLSAATFAPELPDSVPIGEEPGFLLRHRRTVTNTHLENARTSFLEGDYLAESDGKSLWRITARVGALKDVDYGSFKNDVKQVIKDHLTSELARLEQSRPAEAEAALALRVAEDADGSLAVHDAGVRVTFTGLVPIVYQAQRSLLDGLIFGFISDLVIVTLVMMIATRDLSAGLILMLPSIFPAVIVFGLLGWLGIVVDVGTVMPPSVALGVTVDDVVHFMLRYREGVKRGLSRPDAIMDAYRGCARAMYQSWGVIGLGLSVFAFSPFQPTQRFGYLMVTLLTVALAGNLLLLPALLASPLGALYGWGLRRKAQKEAEQHAEAENRAAVEPPAVETTVVSVSAGAAVPEPHTVPFQKSPARRSLKTG